MMRSGNPALKESTFLDLGTGTLVRNDAGAMSLNGTVNKTALLLVLTLAGALFTWSQFSAAMAAGNPGAVMPYVWGGAIGGFVVALVTVFRKEWAMYTAPLYAVLEGLFLGAVSAMFELHFPGIALLYLVNIGMRLFGFEGMAFIHEGSLLGIAFSGFVVVIAALNLVLDFDFIETGVEQGAPKYMEWYAAFGLLVTLVWLYLEMLRLLSKLQSRN